MKVVAVEPADSPMLNGGKPGPHKIQGIGAELRARRSSTASVYDEIIDVEFDDAVATARRLGAEEGILGGISSGATVWAASSSPSAPRTPARRSSSSSASSASATCRRCSTKICLTERGCVESSRPRSSGRPRHRPARTTPPRAAASRSCSRTRACTPIWAYRLTHRLWVAGWSCSRAAGLAVRALPDGHRDPPRRHHRPSVLHRPRHGRRDRRDRRRRRRRDALPRRHARREGAAGHAAGREAASDAR